MNSAPISRLLPRRPLHRCLYAPHSPLPHPQLRPAHRSLRTPAPAHPRPPPEIEPQSLDPKAFDAPPRNPLDEIAIHRQEAARRAYHMKRIKRATIGLILSMIAPLIIIQFYDLPPPGDKKPKEPERTENKPPSPFNPSSWIKPDRADSPDEVTRSFQGKPVIITPGNKLVVKDSSPSSHTEATELVPTGTSSVPYFPKTIYLPTSPSSSASTSGDTTAPYTLLGLGIRTVSFLGIQVYVVGIYVKTSSLSTFQNSLINHINPAASALIPEEKEALRAALSDPEKSNEIWDAILRQRDPEGVEMALRVVPTRGTDFKHLQDGWMRGIAQRTGEVGRRQGMMLLQQRQERERERVGGQADGDGREVQEKKIRLPKPVDESEFEDESFGEAMRGFRALFAGRGKAGKGSVITFLRDGEGVLRGFFQKEGKEGEEEKFVRMGEVRDERVGRLVWLLYLGGKKVSSEPTRRSVVEGCLGIVERPVGTVEGRVE
ncbi:hypothetical protein K432DRAFT_401360 [Lepidopterella palustris CBS 459.81]|uniref:Chalcone isomerase domain-containing protein n=1 Tax=Lepidopterella palustris CBS 459.81 TaxID=1314670 RepID=A0A8E2EHS2_9PEZI|nr:hypothetical protein K432DRAFT_401360 [Lepidopterella palustris CBS 459.81]